MEDEEAGFSLCLFHVVFLCVYRGQCTVGRPWRMRKQDFNVFISHCVYVFIEDSVQWEGHGG